MGFDKLLAGLGRFAVGRLQELISSAVISQAG